MKSLKIFGIVAGALVGLVVVAVALALSSSVQTWAVRKAVADQPGLTIEVGRVAAGFSAAEITGLRVVQPGLVVSAASVTTRHSAWAYIAGRRVDVDELIVKDLVVDLRPAAAPAAGSPAASAVAKTAAPSAAKTAAAPPAPAAKADAAKTAFTGLLKQARLPLDVRVGQVAVNGRAVLLDQQQVTFNLKASGIEVGKKGRVEWTVDYADANAGAPIRAVRSTGSVTLSLTPDRRVDTVEVDSVAAAIGPNLPSDQVKLTARIAQPAADGDEEYATGISLIRAGKTENLVSAQARFSAAQGEIAGNWEIALRSEQLAAVLAGFGLPEIAATGAGKFSVKPAASSASASGNLRAAASQLQKLSPALAAIGAIELKSSFDGSLADSTANLNAFAIELADGQGRRFAQIKLLQKVSYRLADRHVTLVNAKEEAARLILDAVPLAWAQPVAAPMILERGDLSLTLAIEAEPDGSRVRARAVEPLTLRSVTVRDAKKQALVENVTLSLRPNIEYTTTKVTAQLADLALMMTTGDALSGSLSAEVTNLTAKPATSFKAQLQAKLVTLQKPFLAFDPGTLTATVEAEGRHEGDSLQLAKASAAVTRDGGKPLVAFDLLQAVQANLKAQTFAVTKPTAVAARVRVGEIPLAWAEPYVATSKLAGALAGANLEVTLRSIDDLTINTPEPIVLRGVSATIEGKALVSTLDLSTDFTATKRKDAVAYDLRRLEIKQGPAALLSLRVAGEAQLGAKFSATAKGSLEVDAAPLLLQPALVPFATLKTGRLVTSFDATVGDATQAKAVISVKNLVAKQDNRALGDIDLSVTAILKADGSGSLSVPLTVVNSGRKSDVTVDGSFGTAADKKTRIFNGKLTSTNLVVDDLQLLAMLAPASEPAKSPPPAATPAPAPARRPTTAPATPVAAKPTRDAAPFWQGVNGRAEVDLKRVLYGKDYTIRAIRGAASITNSRLALENLEGNFRDKPFKLATAITFAPAQAQPYALTGLVDVTGVDVGELLKAGSPGEKPMLETTVKVAAKLNGSGATVADLLERTYGTFDVSGGKGVLRALGRKGETVGTASTLLGLAGAIAGSSNTVSLSRLGQELEEMQFDTFSLKIERDAALNMKFTSIEFLSPNKRLTGTGSVNYVKDAPYDSWPFQFEFKLAGKDFMAQLLNEARVLSGNQDEKGFYPMAVAFPVSGTAAKVNNGLWKILAGTAARAGLEGLLRR